PLLEGPHAGLGPLVPAQGGFLGRLQALRQPVLSFGDRATQVARASLDRLEARRELRRGFLGTVFVRTRSRKSVLGSKQSRLDDLHPPFVDRRRGRCRRGRRTPAGGRRQAAVRPAPGLAAARRAEPKEQMGLVRSRPRVSAARPGARPEAPQEQAFPGAERAASPGRAAPPASRPQSDRHTRFARSGARWVSWKEEDPREFPGPSAPAGRARVGRTVLPPPSAARRAGVLRPPRRGPPPGSRSEGPKREAALPRQAESESRGSRASPSKTAGRLCPCEAVREPPPPDA